MLTCYFTQFLMLLFPPVQNTTGFPPGNCLAELVSHPDLDTPGHI